MAAKKIKITLDDMTFGAYETLQGGDFTEMTLTQQLDLLDMFVVGDVRKLPLSSIDDILTAIQVAVGDLGGN